MIPLTNQPVAERIISRILARECPPQQLLVFGPAGTGKRRAARALAWKLIDPDGVHDPDEPSVDLSVVTASGASIRLEADLEPALADLSARPVVGVRRVLIIDGAERLREQEGAPRILKQLEEPPPLSHVILVTDHLSDLLPTIRSRCLPVPFRSPGWKTIAERLGENGVAPDEAAALARSQGPAALSASTFDRAMRRLGVDLADQLLSGRVAGATLVRSIQGRMERAAGAVHLVLTSKESGKRLTEKIRARIDEETDDRMREALRHVEQEAASDNVWNGLARVIRDRLDTVPSPELLGLIDEVRELGGKRGTRTAIKRAEDQSKRELRRLLTDGWALVLDGAAGYVADALAVALGSEGTVRHRDRLDALRPVSVPSRVRGLQRALDEIQLTRSEMELNPTLDLAVEALAHRIAQAVHARTLPPLVGAGRLPF